MNGCCRRNRARENRRSSAAGRGLGQFGSPGHGAGRQLQRWYRPSAVDVAPGCGEAGVLAATARGASLPNVVAKTILAEALVGAAAEGARKQAHVEPAEFQPIRMAGNRAD